MRRAMTDTPLTSNVDRRKFINGRWTTRAGEANEIAEIASILVQARPERMEAAIKAIEAMQGTEVHSSDPRGKFVVVVEATDVGAIGTTLNLISLMPDVLTAALVFHGTDEG
jgi:nitrate reductase NapD